MTDTTAQEPFELAQQAADALRERTGVDRYKIALTLGSGWGGAADLLGETVSEVPAHEIPGFSKPALEGHGGTLRSIRLADGSHALVIGARTTSTRARACAPCPTVFGPRRPRAARS